ncbi:reverse transcriptase domain-containing protein [Tanacetum coccineum]
MAHESISHTKEQGDKVAENASNKRKWEGNHNGSSNQQQNKKHKVFGAYTAGLSNKKFYAGNIPLCNKCKFYHNGPTLTCFECGNQGHYRKDCLELKNQNHRNQAGGTEARGMV